MVTIQYKMNRSNHFTVVDSTLTYYPGERREGPYQDPNLVARPEYELNYLRVFREKSGGLIQEEKERLEIFRMEVVEGELVSPINWESVKLTCIDDPRRREALRELLQEEFSRVDERLSNFTPRGGRA